MLLFGPFHFHLINFFPRNNEGLLVYHFKLLIEHFSHFVGQLFLCNCVYWIFQNDTKFILFIQYVHFRVWWFVIVSTPSFDLLLVMFIQHLFKIALGILLLSALNLPSLGQSWGS